ncbi:hypothetical protein CYMTET_48642 [Cymbomonas tetramitiformis]|uniref:Uncharacterized protein n=1 Tax=Cymbomonas tetramitiformis TaxID=36881 RepID=A0AAE0BTJ7_9CHLO|nr:hypothetical protein CYMTET_48642 [Cymbomonas tetramitiformis]
MASRRHSLATIFGNAAARHAVTPATPAVATAPVANPANATFVATIRTYLTKEIFYESVAKLVIKKIFEENRKRSVSLATRRTWPSAVVYAKLVPAIKEAFVAEDASFSTLFDLKGATVAVRLEANKLHFSTLELIIHPTSLAGDWLETSAESHPYDAKRVLLEVVHRLLDAGGPFQGTADLLSIRLATNTDPGDAIATFNAYLASARRKSTLDNDEGKSLFIKAIDMWLMPKFKVLPQ